MNTAIIVGSSRDDAQSLKVGTYLEGRISKLLPKSTSQIVDLNKIVFSLEPSTNPGEWSELSEKLNRVDSFIVISPEWHGMATPAIKNFFIHAGGVMSHKPTLLVSVSSGRGGAYPIAELRMSSYKNRRPVYLPDHLIIRHVKEVLNPGEVSESTDDQYIRERIDYTLKILNEYAKALKSVHDSGVIDLDAYPNGM